MLAAAHSLQRVPIGHLQLAALISVDGSVAGDGKGPRLAHGSMGGYMVLGDGCDVWRERVHDGRRKEGRM